MHTQLSGELVNGKSTDILELLKDEHLPSKYSLEDISILYYNRLKGVGVVGMYHK